MSEPEGFDAKGFLARWSRRKREAPEAAPDADAPQSQAANTGTAAKSADGSPAPQSEAAVALDLTKLPALESITAGSDIRAFLSAGVPEQLRRAALRRAWTADPAIRDFVGLAENAWDFTAPDSMPGFGPVLATDDVARMAARIMGKEKPTTPAARADADAAPSDSAHELGAGAGTMGRSIPPEITDCAEDQTNPVVADSGTATAPLDDGKAHDIAAQNEAVPESGPAARAHGGAVPR